MNTKKENRSDKGLLEWGNPIAYVGKGRKLLLYDTYANGTKMRSGINLEFGVTRHGYMICYESLDNLANYDKTNRPEPANNEINVPKGEKRLNNVLARTGQIQ